MPPEVPATVKARVVDPVTEMSPPENEAPVTVPPPAGTPQLPSPFRNVLEEQEPVHRTITSELIAGVQGEVPLAFGMPVRVASPVPPRLAGSVPVVCVTILILV